MARREKAHKIRSLHNRMHEHLSEKDVEELKKAPVKKEDIKPPIKGKEDQTKGKSKDAKKSDSDSSDDDEKSESSNSSDSDDDKESGKDSGSDGDKTDDSDSDKDVKKPEHKEKKPLKIKKKATLLEKSKGEDKENKES